MITYINTHFRLCTKIKIKFMKETMSHDLPKRVF